MELADFEVNVNPLDFQDSGFGLAADSMEWMRDQGEMTFNRTVGAGNLDTFNSFLSDNLERANFDFDTLPPEILRRVEGSALSRAIGGPAGMAENLSVENKLRLQQQSEQSAFRALGFKQGFMPDVLNPIDTVMDLARFEQQNQISSAGIQAQALGAVADLEMSRFALEAGYQPPNTAGIGAAAGAQAANTMSQAFMTAGMMYGTYGGGNTYGAQTQPQQQQYSSMTPDWRTNATSYPGAATSTPTATAYYGSP